MKTKALLAFSLVCLGLTGLPAVASTTTEENEAVQLPVYVVSEPRHTPAEQEIKRSVDAACALAAKPVKVKIALPLPQVKNLRAQTNEKITTPKVIVAGL